MATRNKICLFDVDGTLTEPMKSILPEFKQYLQELRKTVVIATVGGSNLEKQLTQIGSDTFALFDYVFAENGLLAFRGGQEIHRMEFKKHFEEKDIKRFINFILHYIADLDIPVKRGTFIEFRTGMLNVSPIGRNCSYEERIEFNVLDQHQGIRKKLAEALQANFPEMKLNYALGGMISIDIFPIGWDKTYCLRHITSENFEEIHFFGDKTAEGGNDFEIYQHPLTIGHAVEGPLDTLAQLKALFPEVK